MKEFFAAIVGKTTPNYTCIRVKRAVADLGFTQIAIKNGASITIETTVTALGAIALKLRVCDC